MAYRFYLSDVVGDGKTIPTAFKSRFSEMAKGTGIEYYEIHDTGKKMGCCWVVANLTGAQHNNFVADPAIRCIKKSLMVKTLATLNAAQQAEITEILEHFGVATVVNAIFSQQARVRDIIRWLIGGRYWDGHKKWMDNATD